MDRMQAEGAASAILAPHMEQQAERASEVKMRAAQEVAHRHAAQWGAVGGIVGAAAAYLIADRWYMGFPVGFCAGYFVGRWFFGRRA